MNDRSIDSTAQILAKYRKDNRVKLFFQNDRGPTNSLNGLVKFAQGKFIARMDADDISLPEKIEQQVAYLKKSPQKGLVCTGKWNIIADGKIIDGLCFPDDHCFLVSMLQKGINPINQGTMMFRKELLNKIEWPHRFAYGQDFDFLLRISEHCQIWIIQEVLYKFRISHGSISSTIYHTRAQQKALQMKFYDRRKKELPEGDWKEEKKSISHPQQAKSEFLRNAHFNYTCGHAWFNSGGISKFRKLFFNFFKMSKIHV